MGCLPIVRENPGIEMVLADAFHDVLSQHHRDNIRIVPLDGSFQAIDQDSLDSEDYLKRYGKRLKLDDTVILRVDSLPDSRIIARWAVFRDDASFTVADTVVPAQAAIPIRHILEALHLSVPPEWDLASLSAESFQTFGKARFALLTGDWARAKRIMDSAHLGNLKNETLCLLNADIQIAKEIAEGPHPGLADARTCLLVLPDSSTARNLRLAEIDVLEEKWNAAEESFRLILNKNPDNAEALFWLSRLHPSRYSAFGFSSREQILDRVIALNPACEKARLARAESYFFRHQFGKARACYQALLAIHPRSLDGWMALGKLAMLQNNFPEIIRIYETVLSIAPENADAYYNLGIAYYHDGKVDLARKIFEKAVDLGDHANAHYYLGVLDEASGNRDGAIRHFRRRLQLRTGPDDAIAEEARKHLYELIHSGQDAFPAQVG